MTLWASPASACSVSSSNCCSTLSSHCRGKINMYAVEVNELFTVRTPKRHNRTKGTCSHTLRRVIWLATAIWIRCKPCNSVTRAFSSFCWQIIFHQYLISLIIRYYATSIMLVWHDGDGRKITLLDGRDIGQPAPGSRKETPKQDDLYK